MSIIHKCKVQCHTVNPSEMEMLGIDEDLGKWLPFAIDLSIINAIKMSTDEKGEPTYNCSTIFCSTGDSFILDTPYATMVEIWCDYSDGIWNLPGKKDENQDDINL